MSNKYKFNGGTELNRTFDVNLYETMFRSYDPQIGRFHQPDPLTESTSNWSAYSFVQNNPGLYNDPLGLDTTFGGGTYQWDGNPLPEIIIKGKKHDPYYYDDYPDYWSNYHVPGFGDQESHEKGPGYAAEQRLRAALAEVERNKVEKKESSDINWGGVGNASLGLLGGVGEMIVGGVGEYFSAGTSTAVSVTLIADGGVRAASNSARLMAYLTGHSDAGNAIPGNAGAWIGKGVDMANGKSFNEYGYGQAIGGSINDVASFVVTGGSIGPLNEFMIAPTPSHIFGYISAFGGYSYGLYEDYAPLNH